MSLDVTLLNRENFGRSAPEALETYGYQAEISDLAVLLGGRMHERSFSEERISSADYWLSSRPKDYYEVDMIFTSGDLSYCAPYERSCGIRPVLLAPDASSVGLDKAQPLQKISGWNNNAWRKLSVDIVKYGEYPQQIADEITAIELERAFQNNRLQATDKIYTFDSEELNAYDKPFNPKEHAEYQHKGKRYVRVEARPYDDRATLSDGTTPKAGQSYWVEVQPIEWLRDPSMCISRRVLLAGIQFDEKPMYDGNFNETGMKKYLQEYFEPQMQVGLGLDDPAPLGSNTAAIQAQRQRHLDNPPSPGL